MATHPAYRECMNRSRTLEKLAYRLCQLADSTQRPSHSARESERRIEEAEAISVELRSEFRGKPRNDLYP